MLPVRYDPEDRSAVAIDVPAIRAEVEEEQERLDREAVDRGRRALEGGAAASREGGAGVPLQAAGAQLVELTNLRRALDAGEIAPDEYEKRRSQIVATDEPPPSE